MTTTPRRKRSATPARSPEDTAQEFLFYREQVNEQGRIKESRAKDMRTYVQQHGVPVDEDNEYSTLQWEFEKPIRVGDKRFTGLELRYTQPTPEFDEEAALELIEKKGLRRSCTKLVRIVDQDALYVAQQQGKVTEDEMDSLLRNPEDDEDYKPKYALWPIDAEPEAV